MAKETVQQLVVPPTPLVQPVSARGGFSLCTHGGAKAHVVHPFLSERCRVSVREYAMLH